MIGVALQNHKGPNECASTFMLDVRSTSSDATQTKTGPADKGRKREKERVWTVEELADSLNVSTKTISRWRRFGLVSCRFVSDGRQRVGFLESSVRRFVRQNPDRVRRGAQFSQLTNQQRSWIIRRARDLAQAGQFPADIVKTLATQTRRSTETIRYTINQFDRKNPEGAVFPDHNGQPREETKRKVYRQYLRGDSVEVLSRKFCLAKASIRRVIAQVRARRINQLPLDYIANEEFSRLQSEREILAAAPATEEAPKRVKAPSGLPPYLASLYEIPLLTRQQEVHLFRKMNYLKYKANKLRQKLDPDRPAARLMTKIEKTYENAVATKNDIVRANLRLVVSVAKRHLGLGQDFFELVSDGNVSLMRAVEKFDFARGNKFSTYASWAIMKNFARSVPNELRHRDRYRTSCEDLFEAAEDTRTDQHGQEHAQRERKVRVQELLGYLNERERTIVDRRFGLTRGREPLTLKEVGAEIGVTKERARQLEARAMEKLRRAAVEEGIQLSETLP